MQTHNRYSRAVTNSLHVLLRDAVLLSSVDIHLVTVNWWGIAFPVGCTGLGYCSCTGQFPTTPVPHAIFSVAGYLTVQHQWRHSHLIGSTAVQCHDVSSLTADGWTPYQRVIKTWIGRLQHYRAAALVNMYMLAWGRVIIITRARWPRQHILLSLWQAARMRPIYTFAPDKL